MEDKLTKFLEELYNFDSKLKIFDKDLRLIISQMLSAKPDTQFNLELANKIKSSLMQRIEREKRLRSKNKLIKFNFMKKEKYFYMGAALTSVFVLALILINNTSTRVLDEDEYSFHQSWVEQNQDAFVRLKENAFGSLSLDSVTRDAGESFDDRVSVLSSPSGEREVLGLGSASVQSADLVVSDGSSESLIMIPSPSLNFKYVYKGDDLLLSDKQGDVFRRIYASGGDAQNLLSLLTGMNLNGLSLSSFNNLQLSHLAVSEDKDQGLSVTFDFNRGMVSIYENWQRWRIKERENCALDQACWDRWSLNINDVPSDDALIALANNFIVKHKIDIGPYGPPIVDNSWRQSYDRGNVYIPEYISVIYPYMVDDKVVKSQQGYDVGMRVNINILHKKVSGLNNLGLNRYAVSSYDLASDFQRLVEVAENGGWEFNYLYNSENAQEIGLGTPEKAYVQIWLYEDSSSSELFIPALLFPILTNDLDNYYHRNFVVVPLPLDMLTELEKRQEQVNDDPSILPIPEIRDLPASVIID